MVELGWLLTLGCRSKGLSSKPVLCLNIVDPALQLGSEQGITNILEGFYGGKGREVNVFFTILIYVAGSFKSKYNNTPKE